MLNPAKPSPEPQAGPEYPYEVIDSETDETIDVFETLAEAGRVATDEANRLLRDIIIFDCAAKPGRASRWRVTPAGIARVIGRAS